MKKILFLTGTRADFGKLKPLILGAQDDYEVLVFVTGMHMLSKFGGTYREVEKAGTKNIYKYINQTLNDTMDIVLSKTINGLSDYVKEVSPDLIIVHGDRVEALAGAIVGCLNNVLVGHIEGGELSGTIDGSIRHSITKLSHIHFVANENAESRLLQLGEIKDNIYIIGSPDLDIMSSDHLPTVQEVKERYGIEYPSYSILMFHPVTTEYSTIAKQTKEILKALKKSGENVVAIYPNNDHGFEKILEVYEEFSACKNFMLFPSIRFEYFLSLLKGARLLIGNSSAGIREAPYYGIPSVDIGSRQMARVESVESITHSQPKVNDILKAIKSTAGKQFTSSAQFGDGTSTQEFLDILGQGELWKVDRQKYFVDMVSR